MRSPFAGEDGWQALGDRVSWRADGSFELLGRADRIAKIEDKRVSLSEIERRLLEHAFVKDVVAVALEDSARQYIGVVVELTAAGREALTAQGKAAVNSALRSSLRGRVDAVALPRAFRYPGGIAGGCTGQTPDRGARRIVRCQAVTTEPIVVEQRVAPPEAELRLLIPDDLEYCRGHFAGAPIVPGVVQVKWAIEAARRHLAGER